MAAVDENMAGATLVAVSTENASSVTVDNDKFEIADGNLKLKDDMSLDFEVDGDSIVVTITASGDGASATHAVTVTVNDLNEAPTIEVADGETPDGMPANSTVDEANAGAILGAITLSDSDTGQTHTLTVTGDDRVVTKQDDAGGWWLALADGESFDYETDGASIMVTVTVTDSGDPAMSASTDVTITINNVNESAEVNGGVDDMTFVGGEESSMDVDLKALFTDPDGDALTYRLSDNAPDWLTFSVTTTGTGDSQTVTGTLSGTPAAGTEGDVADVSIIASDDDGAEAHAMFDLIIDAANDAPDRLELRVTDEDGLVIRTTEVNVDENAMGVELGSVYLRDPDDARHPHGQHEYSFSDDRFEVADGMLKLKADASLDRETDGSEIDLTITATDMAEGDAALSIELTITIMIGNVDTGSSEGPRRARDADGELKEIKAVTITVDDDLEDDVDDVDAGDWLEMIPMGLSAAFEDPDGDDLTYSLGSGAPRWLEIDEDTGELTNKERMVPNRGVYDVNIVASDDDGNSASAPVQIAVALSGPNDSDNDEPRIREIDEIGYTEGDESGAVVATFEVDDDDIELAPHPYGIHKIEFTAHQDPGNRTDDLIDVTNAFKIVWVRDDGNDTAYYEIRAKTPAELAMGADGPDMDKDPDVYPKGHAMEGEVIPVPAIDYEAGEDIEFIVTVTDMDGDGEEDEADIDIEVENAADESPMFQVAPTGGTRVADEMTTTISVDQQTSGRTILVMRVDELWDDDDTDDDDLDIDVPESGKDLPDWIKVYGPDRWDDIYENRRTDITDDEVDAVTDIRDRDEVILVVIDRTATEDGEDVSLTGGSFTITADDGDNDPVTETIMIDVTNTNVAPPDATKVVSISGGDPNKAKEVTGTGDLTMHVNLELDPDFAGGETPYLVLYSWMVSTGVDDDAATPEDESMTTISVSATEHTLALGEENDQGMTIRIAAYVDQTITAKVEVFERDPANKNKVAPVQTYMATVEVASAADSPVTPPTPTSVSFGDITTDTTGLVVTIAATGEAAEAGTARLQSSTNGTSGWINVDSASADTTTGVTTSPVTLDVNADGDSSAGDGGGLYYRIVYVYDDDGDEMEVASDVIQLGSNPAPGSTDDALVNPPDITLQVPPSPAVPASGDTIRVNSGTANVEVQWQMGEDTDASGAVDADEWMDLAGETGQTLTLTDDHAGNSVRALLTHKGDTENPSHVTWVDYSAITTVADLPISPNKTPTRNQETHWIDVNLNSDDDEGTGTGSVAGMFFDSDRDDLTYTLVGDSVDDGANGIQPGDTVFRSSQTTTDEADNAGQIIFTLNGVTGDFMFYTNRALSHDNNATDTDSDGGGNWFTVSIEAHDGMADDTDTTDDDLTVNVRVNVAPTDIFINSAATGADKANATDSTISLAETDDFDAATAAGTTSIALDVQDLNDGIGDDAHSYGTHTVTVDDKRFEVVSEVESGGTEDNDGSTWVLRVKDGVEFDFEDDDDEDADATTDGKQIVLKITATDGGGKKTEGYVTFTLTDVQTDDPQDNQPSANAGSGGVMTTGGNAGDDDGPGNAPGDGGAWIDEQHFIEVDLLEEFVISIDDIDIA